MSGNDAEKAAIGDEFQRLSGEPDTVDKYMRIGELQRRAANVLDEDEIASVQIENERARLREKLNINQ